MLILSIAEVYKHENLCPVLKHKCDDMIMIYTYKVKVDLENEKLNKQVSLCE